MDGSKTEKREERSGELARERTKQYQSGSREEDSRENNREGASNRLITGGNRDREKEDREKAD